MEEDIHRNEAILDETTESTTPVEKTLRIGNIVRIHGHEVRVERVNPKTISGVIVKGGASGMRGKWDKSWLQKR